MITSSGNLKLRLLLHYAFFCLTGIPFSTSAQVVNVTLVADTNRIPVGSSTMLRAYAQIIEPMRTGSDRIFSWYIDIQSGSDSIAKPDYANLLKPDSDNDPLTSSPGISSGASRIGIYDYFMSREGAGKTTPVLLFTVPIKGISVGSEEYRIKAGTGVPALAEDFIVAPAGGGDPITGGIYSNAAVKIEVIAGTITTPLDPFPITLARTSPASKNLINMTWPVQAGWRYSLEYRNDLKPATSWQPMPSVALTTGSATITNVGPAQFFRIKAEPSN